MMSHCLITTKPQRPWFSSTFLVTLLESDSELFKAVSTNGSGRTLLMNIQYQLALKAGNYFLFIVYAAVREEKTRGHVFDIDLIQLQSI